MKDDLSQSDLTQADDHKKAGPRVTISESDQMPIAQDPPKHTRPSSPNSKASSKRPFVATRKV
jgi:hypothetical protein